MALFAVPANWPSHAHFVTACPRIVRPLQNRFAYLDPLNHVQLLLKRYRTGSFDDHIIEGIHLTIDGIATGLRNSG